MAEPAKPRSKRGWFRRLLRGAGWLLLALIVLHRPIIHYGGPLAGRIFASRHHLDARFKLSGTIFTNLRVSGIRVVPNGRGPTPVEKIEIAELRFDYSLVKLIRDGIGEFMHSYEVHHADLAFVALPSKTKAERQQKFTIAQRLNDILARPAAYADRVLIDDFSVRVRSPDDETVVGPVHLLLDPAQTGFLRITRLQVPGVPVWENLSATTSYVNRNVLIKDLALAPEIMVDELNFDASQRAQKRGKLAVAAHLFGGQLALDLTGQELEKKGENLERGYATHLRLSAAEIDVPTAAAYFGMSRPPVGKLTKLELDFAGEPEKPQTWDGSLAAVVAEASAGTLAIQPVEFGVRVKSGRGSVRASALIGSNRAELSAKVGLPSSVNELHASEVEATVSVAGPKMEEIGARFTPPLALKGDLAVNGTMTMRERRAGVDLKVALTKAAFETYATERAQINLRGSKLLVRGIPALAGLTADIDARFQSLRAGTITVDSARLAAVVREKQIQVETLEIIRGENSVVAKGGYELPADFTQFGNAPGRAEFTIHAPRLVEFGLGAGDKILSGKLEGSGELRTANGLAAGSISIDGSDFEFGGARAERLLAKVIVVDQKAIIEQLVLRLQERDQIAITGHAGIESPFAYDGSVDVAIRDLAAFQAALASFGVKEKVAGSIALRVVGKGQVQPGQHTGDATLRIDGVRYGKLEVRELRLAGSYSPRLAESRELHIVSGVTSIDGAMEWREGKLRLHDLDLRQAGQEALTGFVIVPFDPERPERIIPFDQRLAVNFNAKNLDVGKLAASFGQKSPVSGTFDWNLVASGTVQEPVLHLKVAGRGLKAAAAPQYDPAELDLTLHYANKELDLDATAKQPLVQPLKIAGTVPLDLDALINKKKLDPEMPLNGSLTMPASSLAVLPKVVPAIRRIDGTAALDVRVSGTVGKPAFSGKAAIRLKEARMVAPNIPAIGGFTADLVFGNDTLNLQTFRGEVGGGTFGMTGTIKLAHLDDPVFDLQLKADDVLAMRDDTMTLRTDADLKFAGPLKAANASGTVWITQSRFFKEIDILPIGLPGRPKPAPKTAPRDTTVSFPNPPLRDMKFDIAIKTRENDPFLIRGNLANGGVHVALQLGGTGLQPWLDGTITFQEFIASLPFSTLTISRGFVHFKKDEPFQPTLDLQAESKVRDYTVGAYIYGRASDPQVQFTSEPPLPHADIVSLLATGTTTAELAGSADVLASRAAMLAIQSLYRKTFQKGRKTAPPLGGPKKDPGGASWLDRFQVEMGAFDSRTGARAATGRFKINEQMFLLGELDTQGRYTGSFKYLLRFR